MGLTIKEIQEIIDLLEHYSVIDFELESNGTKITLKKTSSVPALKTPKELLPSPPPEPSPEKQNIVVQKSNLVGTFYRAVIEKKDPESVLTETGPVEEGDFVKKGQIIGYINVLGVPTDIEAETSGIIINILKNKELVEYDETIIKIQPQQPKPQQS